jgi:hypothetical protein
MRLRPLLISFYSYSMKASPLSWELPPFKDGVPFSYAAAFNSEQLALLKEGLTPRDMDDKWVVFYEEPHLFIYRSWTRQPWYRFTLRSTPDDGAEVAEVMLSKDLAGVSSVDHLRIINIVVSNLLSRQAKRSPEPAGPNETTRKKRWWQIL